MLGFSTYDLVMERSSSSVKVLSSLDLIEADVAWRAEVREAVRGFFVKALTDKDVKARQRKATG